MIDGSFRESFHSIRFFCSQTLPADQYELLWVEYHDRVGPALRAEIDEDAWSTLYSTTSRPFPRPTTRKIAVKVINHYGDEIMKVYEVANL